jgi:hypothetical protein
MLYAARESPPARDAVPAIFGDSFAGRHQRAGDYQATVGGQGLGDAAR